LYGRRRAFGARGSIPALADLKTAMSAGASGACSRAISPRGGCSAQIGARYSLFFSGCARPPTICLKNQLFAGKMS
jgi:hypothetical protein